MTEAEADDEDIEDESVTTGSPGLTIEEVEPNEVERTTPYDIESLRYETRMAIRDLYPIRDPTGTILFGAGGNQVSYMFTIDRQVIDFRNDYDGVEDVISEVVDLLRDDEMVASRGFDIAEATAKVRFQDELTASVQLVLS